MIDANDPDFSNTPVSDRRPQLPFRAADPAAPPLATIVTPFFNTDAVFGETAACILGQSLQQWEWIIVNDGSTDPIALGLLEEYRRRDSRIRVIDHPINRGLSAARNTGFAAATTEYVVQLDSDDLLEPTAIEKWWWYLGTSPNVAFVKGYSVGFGAIEYLWTRGFHSGRSFLDQNLVNATGMIRKSVHLAVGGYDESMTSGLEDWDFWLRCASAGYWGCTMPEYLDWYRRRPDHAERWAALGDAHREAFRARSRLRYPKLWIDPFPSVGSRDDAVSGWQKTHGPLDGNRLQKPGLRVLVLVAGTESDSDERLCFELVRLLIEAGVDVSVVAARAESQTSAFETLTPDVFVLPHFISVSDHSAFLRYLAASRQIDAIVVNDSDWARIGAAYLCAQIPALRCVQIGNVARTPLASSEVLGVPSVDWMDMHVTAFDLTKQELVSSGIDPHRVEVCRPLACIEVVDVALEDRLATRAALKLPPELPLLAFDDTMDADGQPYILARTLVCMREQHRDWLAMVRGRGPDLGWLHDFVERHHLSENVRIVSDDPADAEHSRPQWLSAADVFFYPSRRKTVNSTVLLALASALPVVAEANSAVTAFVDDRCGVLITSADEDTEAESYASVLLALLGEPARARSLGVAGREAVREMYSTQALGRSFKSLLGKAIAAPARSNEVPMDGDRALLLSRQLTEAFTRCREITRRDTANADFEQGAAKWRHLLWDERARVFSLQGQVGALQAQLAQQVQRRDDLDRALAAATMRQRGLEEAIHSLETARWVRLGRRLELLKSNRTP